MKSKVKHASFDVSTPDRAIIRRLARRASAMAKEYGFEYPLVDANMDITACHANGMDLNLEKFESFDDFNFAHDAFGIRRHINRETGEIQNCFVPRCHCNKVEALV